MVVVVASGVVMRFVLFSVVAELGVEAGVVGVAERRGGFGSSPICLLSI